MTRLQPDLPVRVKRENADVDLNPGHRRVVAELIASMFLSPLAHALPSVAASTPGENFMALSLFATGRSKLDPQIGAKPFAALRESNASFAGRVVPLAEDAASGKYGDVESLEAAIRGTPKHVALLTLISGRYTGTVSVKGKPRLITLGDALMYQPIADGSHIPGNCAGATNAWADLPYPALDAVPTL